MLETVLRIGEAFRKSPTGLKHHRYVMPCPQDTEKRKILRLSLPVNKDFSFDFNSIKEITDENIIRDKLFYLTFKTSDADTSIKYVYGDVYYARDKKNKESGNFRTITYSAYNAFERAKTAIAGLQNKRILDFRTAYEREKVQIEKILLEYPSWKNNFDYSAIFLHFDFQDGVKDWYTKEELEDINRLMINHFCSEIRNDKANGFVFNSMLYRTICSGDEKNDIQFPFFSNVHKYKSSLFSSNDVSDLFYAIDYTEKPSLRPVDFWVGGANEKIKIIVLPRGENLNAVDFEQFNISREEVIKIANDTGNNDLLFAPLVEKVGSSIISFDVIFVKEGQNVDTDLSEVSGIEKSFVKDISDRLNCIRIPIEDKCNKHLSIIRSFLNILGDGTKTNKKYQSHLYKVLPQIYTGTYYNDSILLPALIEKTEANIRAGKADFNLLKYDFYFLVRIQNTVQEGENLMKIQESQSYKIGLLLGELAKQFAAWRDDCPIKSFEKSYVGTLSRRITTIDDFIRFKSFIEEKLILHERVSFTHQISAKLSEEIKALETSSKEKYDKQKCAFGFFESYFAPVTGKQDNTATVDKANS